MSEHIRNFFSLSEANKSYLQSLPSPFPTAVGEIVYYRTYSRRKKNGTQEHWADTVIRVTEGILSVRKDYYIKHNLGWRDEEWQEFAKDFSEYMYNMKFLPPGRGLWAMGTEYMYERGSAALNNCGACTTKDMILGATWTMDMLMCGVGVGASVDWEGHVVVPDKTRYVHHVIPDSREGWVNSLKHLLDAYIPNQKGETKKFPKFDYSKIRKKGAPIRGFGGTASGPGPLQDLHYRVEWYLDTYIKYKETHSTECVAEMFKTFFEKGFYLSMQPNTEYGQTEFDKKCKQIKYSRTIRYDKTRCCADIINAIGVCVVAGNVRRSAEILLGDPGDETFLNLKNYTRDPSREDIGWMSNNSVRLDQTWQFSEFIPSIAERIRNNGEPGVINLKNIQRYGRFGREAGTKGIVEDQATVSNPCVTGDTLILTDKGKIPVTELVGKQFLAHVDGDHHSSTSDGFWSTGVKDVLKITTKSGSSIKVTKNHRLLTNKSWVEAQNLQVGDAVQYQFQRNLDDKDREVYNSLNYYFGTMLRSSYDTIANIEDAGQEEVYDCTIPNIHKYVGNGFVNHNCGEIPLEPFELCNLSECFPSRCFKPRDPNSGPLNADDEYFDEDEFLKALEFATFYTSTVSLLPTQWEVTNKVIARNRRIGVSLSGIADVYDRIGQARLTRILRNGYNHVREINNKLARDAGVPPSIRCTTVKPSGSISQLAGVSSGMHFPTFKYAIRRIMVSDTSPICKVLVDNGVPYEKSVYTNGTYVFSFPIDQGKTRAATNVSMWEQFALLATLQREWADNMVSCTIYFQPESEGSHIEHALGQFIPLIKSVSMLPHTENGVYAQAPYEGIDLEKYKQLAAEIKRIDWSDYGGTDGEMPTYCTNGVCELSSK